MNLLRGLILLTILAIVLLQLNNLERDQLSNLSFEELKTYFTNLSNKKGAGYAFEVLKNASVAPGTDMHLLGHVVGDILYKQLGAEGIKVCSQDFRNACSHSIVVGLFTDKGEEALTEIQEACKKAPGGLGAYMMCYHGLGHGILAYTAYDFKETIGLCQKTGTKEYPECVGGAVMEMISGGGHDQHLWARMRPNYLKKDDPFNICSKEFLDYEGSVRCYDYITPFLWEAVGADINNPTDDNFRQAFKLCELVVDKNLRNICYQGFGKEFVGLAQARDIRKIDQMDEQKLKKVVKWCKLSESKDGYSECLSHALNSLFWGGENDYHVSIKFCHAIEDSTDQNNCFINLIDRAAFYIKDKDVRASICRQIPAQFNSECTKKLSSVCDNLDLIAKKQCYEETVEQTLKKNGIEASFDLVDYLYQKDADFASDCHSYIHLVGEKAYQLFSQGKHLKLSSKASSCGYGFYHGFMETLLLAGEDLKKAEQFCEWAEKEVGGKNDVKGACFHGIGHGLTENHDKKEWLNEQELVNNPLIICEQVSADESMINRCASGVFNVLAIKYNSAALPLNKQNPLGFCKTQTKPYFKKPCYEEMNTMLISISKNNLVLAANYLKNLEDEYAKSAMRSLAGVIGMGYKEASFFPHIETCRKLEEQFHLPCIRGFVGGLIEGQPPGTQEVGAMNFCSSGLSDEEKTNCYQEALRLLSLYLTLERYQNVCKNLDQKYQRYCVT